MRVERVFVSLNASDFDALAAWWSDVLGRKWDREPMPSCREWDVAGCVLFQILDSPGQGEGGRVGFRVADLDGEIERLRTAGIEAPDQVKVDGFKTLRLCEFEDPEGNSVSLLDGE